MKLFLLCGGFTGFALVFLAGLVSGGPIGTVLRDAAIGCLVGALLMQWLFRVVGRSLHDAAAEQQRRLSEQVSGAAEEQTN